VRLFREERLTDVRVQEGGRSGQANEDRGFECVVRGEPPAGRDSHRPGKFINKLTAKECP
jgi:hypothetical protein